MPNNEGQTPRTDNASTMTNAPGLPPRLVTVDNAVLTRSMAVLTASGIPAAAQFQQLPKNFERRSLLYAVGSLLKNRTRLVPRDTSYFFVFNPWGSGYHHWLAEVVPKLVEFEDVCRRGTLITPDVLPLFVAEFFELFGFTNTYRLSGNGFFRELNLISNPRSGHFDPQVMIAARDRIMKKLGVKAERQDLIYVTRRNARARRVVNEDVLKASLVKVGFNVVDLDGMSFASQVELFANCQTLISIHGAALTNMLFMPPASRVIELFPRLLDRDKELNACYHRLASALGHEHEFLWCKRSADSSNYAVDTGDIEVEPDKLTSCLEGADEIRTRRPIP